MILSFKAVIFVLGNVYITNLLKAGKNKNRHSGGSYKTLTIVQYLPATDGSLRLKAF